MPSSLIVNHLKTVLTAEQIQIHEGALKIIAKSARGSMRDALSLTDQAIAYSSSNMTEEAVRKMLGSLDDRYLIRMIDALADKNGKELVDITSEMGLMSISFSTALQDLASLLQKIAMAQVIPESVLEEWPEAQDIIRLAKLISKEEVQLFYQIAITSRSDLLLAPEEETGFMMTLLRMLAFMPDDGQELSPSGPSVPPANKSPNPQGLTNRKAPTAIHSSSVPTAPSTPTSGLTSAPEIKSVAIASLDELSPQAWRDTIKKLGLKGLEGQFALQTALISHQDKSGTIYIKLATDLPQLATTTSIQQLTDALQKFFHVPFKISIEKSTEVVTVAHLEAKDQAIAKTELEKTVSVDPFLEQLKQEIGVTVIEGSIRPLS
jgi:DNA polymerase-3 subunit gamma/tau